MAEIPPMADLLSVLGDEEALSMFASSAEGFDGGKSALLTGKLSKKQFYSRLQKLVDVGLIRKESGVYRQTILGKLVYTLQIKPMQKVLGGYWTLQAVEELKRSQVIPEQEREKMIQTLLGRANLREAFPSSEKFPARLIGSYPDLVEALLQMLDLAQTEIHMASRFYEPSVGSALVAKFAHGVSLNILDDNPSGTSFVSRVRESAKADSKNRQVLLKLLDSPIVKVGSGGLGLSFAIVDRKYCQIELLNPLSPNEFFAALQIEDRDFVARLIEIFDRTMLKYSVKEPIGRELLVEKE
jgi:predicted transcriptional regulator